MVQDRRKSTITQKAIKISSLFREPTQQTIQIMITKICQNSTAAAGK